MEEGWGVVGLLRWRDELMWRRRPPAVFARPPCPHHHPYPSSIEEEGSYALAVRVVLVFGAVELAAQDLVVVGGARQQVGAGGFEPLFHGVAAGPQLGD